MAWAADAFVEYTGKPGELVEAVQRVARDRGLGWQTAFEEPEPSFEEEFFCCGPD